MVDNSLGKPLPVADGIDRAGSIALLGKFCQRAFQDAPSGLLIFFFSFHDSILLQINIDHMVYYYDTTNRPSGQYLFATTEIA